MKTLVLDSAHEKGVTVQLFCVIWKLTFILIITKYIDKYKVRKEYAKKK